MSNLDKETEEAVNAFVSRLPANYSALEIFVFGSRARRDHRPESDADVAVILAGDPADRTAVALAMADISFDIMLDIGILIEAIPFWSNEWETPTLFSNPSLIENIKRQVIRV